MKHPYKILQKLMFGLILLLCLSIITSKITTATTVNNEKARILYKEKSETISVFNNFIT